MVSFFFEGSGKRVGRLFLKYAQLGKCVKLQQNKDCVRRETWEKQKRKGK